MATIDQKVATPALALKAISLKNVLFATDFSPTSEAAFPYASAICRRFGSTLHLVHVMSDTSLLLMTGGVDYVSMGTIYEDAHNEAKEKIDQVAVRLEGIPYRTYVRHGQVWKTLAEIIAANDIDLIVVGTHGRTGLGKLLLGSVAEDILRHAPCPVMTIGPNISGRAKLPAFHGHTRDLAPIELEVRQVVYATNFEEGSENIARRAVRLANEFGARLTLMHVIEDYHNLGSCPGPIEDGVQKLKSLIRQAAALSSTAETIMEFGDPAKAILKIAAERETDLIVLGAKTSVEEVIGATHLPWTTAHQVIAHAACPVLTMRPRPE
ncbi:MAG TPA: universal stress protein [Candidatus Sulfotelmatobacter sp.]|nr:universal stress protein [Candidatus Sulfotelmatobacter sp.]